MKNFITNNFIIILFLFTIIFVIAVLIMGHRLPTASPKPAPILQISPRPTPLIPPQAEQKILSTNIRGQIFRVIDPIVLDFSQPQATSSVSIRLDPATPSIVKRVSPFSIAIEPEGVWEFNRKYSLRVEVLGKEYNFSFQTETRRGI